jgi:hypothetical protein
MFTVQYAGAKRRVFKGESAMVLYRFTGFCLGCSQAVRTAWRDALVLRVGNINSSRQSHVPEAPMLLKPHLCSKYILHSSI